jgi:GT2 family glycosyltransferase
MSAREGLHVPDYRVPEMSVVLVTPDGHETIRTTMKHLRAQTVRDRLEIVIVAASIDALHLDHTETQEFRHFRVVEVGEVRSIAEGNAAGVRQASAPVVALAEDHSYPDPDWAAALIGAHRHPWAAVGPAVRNANPKSVTSWADFPSPTGHGANRPRRGRSNTYRGITAATSVRFSWTMP